MSSQPLTEAEMVDLLMQSYQKSPQAYVKQVLGVTWWKKQIQMSLAVLKHDKVAIQASHAIGKSHWAAGMVNWHHDAFKPGITITTAPTQQQVVDILWKEIRMQRGDRDGNWHRCAPETYPA